MLFPGKNNEGKRHYDYHCSVRWNCAGHAWIIHRLRPHADQAEGTGSSAAHNSTHDPEVVRRAEAATALIKIDNGSIGGFINSGSGFFIASSGEMLTANHVANDRDLAVQVVLADGSKHAAVVEFQNKKGDLTVLHVNGVKNHAFLPAGDSSKLEDGDTLVAVGYPFSIGKTVTSGIVSALDRSLPCR